MLGRRYFSVGVRPFFHHVFPCIWAFRGTCGPYWEGETVGRGMKKPGSGGGKREDSRMGVVVRGGKGKGGHGDRREERRS